MNRDKIKLKHILGVHVDLPGYPNPDDVIYFSVKRAFDRGKDLLFTDALLKKKLGGSPELDENINNSVRTLVESGDVELSRVNKDSNSYRILNNPYEL
tara:strand:+ start:2430 stop:2723 length:294 start_codon:yes stop_codon:yes gene_type:complete